MSLKKNVVEEEFEKFIEENKQKLQEYEYKGKLERSHLNTFDRIAIENYFKNKNDDDDELEEGEIRV